MRGSLRFEDYPSLLSDSRQLGLVSIKHSFTDDYTVQHEIRDCSDLIVVMNDGRSWVDTNRERLVARAAEGKSTRVILLHPKSHSINVLLTTTPNPQPPQIG